MEKILVSKKIRILFIAIMLFIAIFGMFAIYYIGGKVDQDGNNDILSRAKTIATLVDPQDISLLSGTESDLENPTYLTIKKRLEDARAVNPDTQFIYLLGLRDDKQFFYVDSEPSDSPDYSPPGQVYEEMLPVDLEAHQRGVSYVHGPYTDAWGTWISGYSPILNEEGEVIAMVGIDVDVERYALRTQIVQKGLGLILALFLFATYLIANFLKKTVHSINVSENILE